MTYEIDLTCTRPVDPLVEVPFPSCIHTNSVEAYWNNGCWHYKLSGQDQHGYYMSVEFDLLEPVAVNPGGEYPIRSKP